MATANPWSALASGIGSGATLFFKICEYTYALRAVDQQTEEYLLVAQHAEENIKVCQRLLTQRRYLLPSEERRDYERVLQQAKLAAEAVALLLEPARVDMNSDEKLHFSTRLSWVMADNASIAAALRRLDIVHTTLTQNISTLRLLRMDETAPLEAARSNDKPPSYSSLLHWKRQTRLTPRPSMQSLRRDVDDQPTVFAETAIQPSQAERQQDSVSTLFAADLPVAHDEHATKSIVPTLCFSKPVFESDDSRSVQSTGPRPAPHERSLSFLERQAMRSSMMRESRQLA